MSKLSLCVFFIIFNLNVYAAEKNQPPNILLIVVDDVGFTDLGSFGGEIHTPNLDKLANQGTRFTNFYTAQTCSPTRAMLLTGTDNHLVGLGNMHVETAPNQKGKPGYEGHLNNRAANLAEVLQSSGYNTYMTGKWHLGLQPENGPAAKGFDQSYALLNSGGGHFNNLGIFRGPAQYRENGKPVQLDENFYSTRFYTEKMLEYIDNNKNNGKPFFAYLAYTATHWPLQAPKQSIAKYKGHYSLGYDQLHKQRIERAINKGVIPANSKIVPRLKGEPAWNELNAEQKKIEERTMEIYAAMLDDVDQYVGKIVDYLEQTNQLDNTVIFFMSDNGAEGHDTEHGLSILAKWIEGCCDNSYDNMGNANSYLFLGPNWARASVGPAKHYKGFTTEGGIKAPAFIRYPKSTLKQPLSSRFITVQDVMPTLLDLASIDLPQGTFNGRDILPIEGRSLFSKHKEEKADAGWELMGKRGYRYGDWKAIYLPAPYGNGQWQLYNLARDANEQNDLALTHPQKLKELISRWDQYARRNNVILPDRVSGY